jgi:outer membrane biosynthesis protein TonB
MGYSLFTERRALETMFNNLEEEKRQKRAEYRTDIEIIEKRQFEMLDRLKRLDDLEREAVDGEQVLRQLAATTQQLKDLLPDVHVKDVIEKAAEKIASNPEAAAAIDTTPEIDERAERIQKAAQDQKLNSKPAPKPAEPKRKAPYMSKQEGADILAEILIDANEPISAAQIAKELKARTGREFNNIHGAILRWMEQSELNIVKAGSKYSIEENDNNEQKAATA